MMVTVLYFSRLRELAGTAEETYEWEDGGQPLAVLLDQIHARHPALASWSGTLLLAVNGAYATRHDQVRPGDEIALMPPVQGG
jgi:molybdopterin converting factor subunit 1